MLQQAESANETQGNLSKPSTCAILFNYEPKFFFHSVQKILKHDSKDTVKKMPLKSSNVHGIMDHA